MADVTEFAAGLKLIGAAAHFNVPLFDKIHG